MSRMDMSSREIGEYAAQGGQHDALFELGLNFCTGRDGTVDLVDIAKTVVADLAPLAIAAGYEISFHGETAELERQGDRPALVRAVSNLVRNAIEHGGNAGMISVSVSAQGQIIVADQGQGISPDQRELVFEPFYRTTPRSTGAGLGLALVRQIVTNHGGRVAVDSGAAGTRFSIQI